MNLVVLDGHTLNPGDLSWKSLEKLANCQIFNRSSPEEVLSRSSEAEMILTNKAVIDQQVIENCPKLKFIGILATGTNVIDLKTAKKHHISVSNVPGYGTDSVAQMVFAHILNFCQNVASHSESVFSGQWSKQVDWCYWNHPLIELQGKTLGIIGLGDIGAATARIGQAFGMHVCAVRGQNIQGVQKTDLKTLFKESDFISLHCPLTHETEHIINTETLHWMKTSAFLVNTGRGGLVDETALSHALNSNIIAGAGLDVASVEPISSNNPLLHAKNCTITPHIAWASKEARQRLLDIVVANVKAFLEGNPQNLVS